jgi:hypothetical protein
MALSTGIIGLPTVGKTTLFNLLTNSNIETNAFFSGKTGTNFKLADIPDSRIEYLADIYNPKKTTYAQIEITDVPGLVEGSSQGKGVGNDFLQTVRKVSALVHVVRAFENEDVMHVQDSLDVMRDVETINMELLLADLAMIETRIERIESDKKKKKTSQGELEALQKCREFLEEEKMLSQLKMEDEQWENLSHIDFLTLKPMIIVVNIDENQLETGDYQGKEELKNYAESNEITLIEICAQTEMEINELDEEEKTVFMEDLGIAEPGINKLARAIYDQLGLMSFLTAGPDEVRAWTIRKNSTAKEAGGKIHSDIARGFIRAEVISFDDFKESESLTKAKEKGLVRLEGKEYIVQDGDIIEFRFNV